jgi:hypothetical protein
MSDQHSAAGGKEPVYTLDNPPPRLRPDAMVEAAWQSVRAGPDRGLRMLERAPIRLYGIAADFDRVWFLYRDAEGKRQALRANEHDQVGIARLFAGAEGWLCRLWPARDGGWDPERAAETLISFGGMIGTVDAAALGFELPREPLP